MIIPMISKLVLERESDVMRTLQNCSKFSKRSLKERNLAVLEAVNFAKLFIQTSLMGNREGRYELNIRILNYEGETESNYYEKEEEKKWERE